MSGFLPNSYPLARHRDSSNQRHRGTVTARETPTGLSSLLHPTSSLSRPSQPLYNLPSLASGLGPQKSDISRDAWDDDFPNNLRSSDSSIARYTLPSFSPSRANARSLPSLNFSDTGVNSSSLRTPSTMSSPYTTSTSNGRFACRCGHDGTRGLSLLTCQLCYGQHHLTCVLDTGVRAEAAFLCTDCRLFAPSSSATGSSRAASSSRSGYQSFSPGFSSYSLPVPRDSFPRFRDFNSEASTRRQASDTRNLAYTGLTDYSQLGLPLVSQIGSSLPSFGASSALPRLGDPYDALPLATASRQRRPSHSSSNFRDPTQEGLRGDSSRCTKSDFALPATSVGNPSWSLTNTAEPEVQDRDAIFFAHADQFTKYAKDALFRSHPLAPFEQKNTSVVAMNETRNHRAPYSQQRGTHCPWEMQAERLHSNGSKALRLLPSKVISQHNDACLWKLSNPKRPMTENPHWAAIQLHDSSGPSVSAPAASKSSSNSYFFSRPADAPHYSAHALPDATLQDKALMTEPGDAVSYLSDRPQVVTVTRGSRGRKFEPRCLGARTQSQKTSGLYKSPMIRNHSKVKMLGGIRAQRTVRCLDSAPYCPPKRRYTTLPSDLVDKVQMETEGIETVPACTREGHNVPRAAESLPTHELHCQQLANESSWFDDVDIVDESDTDWASDSDAVRCSVPHYRQLPRGMGSKLHFVEGLLSSDSDTDSCTSTNIFPVSDMRTTAAEASGEHSSIRQKRKEWLRDFGHPSRSKRWVEE